MAARRPPRSPEFRSDAERGPSQRHRCAAAAEPPPPLELAPAPGAPLAVFAPRGLPALPPNASPPERCPCGASAGVAGGFPPSGADISVGRSGSGAKERRAPPGFSLPHRAGNGTLLSKGKLGGGR